MESPCNITIGMATGGTIRSETVTSLIGAMDVLKSHGVGINLSIQIGGYAARNRNALADVALNNGSNYLMFIDNDMVFKPSAIQRLLDHDKDIVGVHYNARGVMGKPVISTVKLADENGNLTSSDHMPAQLFKCFAVGTGLMLVKTSVFPKLKRPYFVAYEEEDGEHHTEDVEFCRKAHDAGIDVWCSPTIEVGHIGNYTY